MKHGTIVGLLVICCAWSAEANAQPPTSCDRECLRGKVTQLLYALLKHDVSGLPVADTLRVTEDAVEKPLAKVGLVGTVTRLRGFRQDIIDGAPAWRERTVRGRRLSLRERPGDGRAGLQVRPRLPEHLHAVARDFPAPRRRADARHRCG